MRSLSKLIVASSIIGIWSLLWPKSAIAQAQATTSIKQALTQTQNLLWEINDQNLLDIPYWQISFKLDYNHLWENNIISNIEIYHLWELIWTIYIENHNNQEPIIKILKQNYNHKKREIIKNLWFVRTWLDLTAKSKFIDILKNNIIPQLQFNTIVKL